MTTTFNGATEPMRALRDLIELCEMTFRGPANSSAEEEAILNRAQAALTALRKLFGDERPAEDIADADMIEPKIASVPALVKTLQQAAGALHKYERMSLVDPSTPIKFVGDWAHLGTMFISDIVDFANEVLEGAVP